MENLLVDLELFTCGRRQRKESWRLFKAVSFL